MQVRRVAIERSGDLLQTRSIDADEVQFLGLVACLRERVADERHELPVRRDPRIRPVPALGDQLSPITRCDVDREDVGIAVAQVGIGHIETVDDDRASVG